MKQTIPTFLLLAASSAALFAQYPGQYPPQGGPPPQYPQPQYPQQQYPQYPQQQYPQQGYPQPRPYPNTGGYPNQGQYPLPGGPSQQPANPGYDDQPGQPVARLSVMNGDASVLRGGSGDWTAAVVNAPLAAGDAIAVPQGSRIELQLDSANFLRVDGNSELRIAAFDQGRAQIQISRGVVTWRVLRQSPLQVEISTPSAAVHPFPFSAVRVEIAPDGQTRIVVRHGDAEASTARGTERIHEGSMMMLRGDAPADGEYQIVYASPLDGWDGFNDQRDAYLSRAQSNRYLSPDIYGGEDLDAAGRWGYDPAYGDVWTPTVPAGWAPYRDGSWVWSDYYGWTWVDASPWGWAPYHYGSWYLRAGFGWTWFPGSRFGHYWYRPAMVSFFGFGANIGWVPLAPFEGFHPWYGRGLRPGIGFGGGIGGGVGVVAGYRNAGFAVGVGAADFQRGAFANRFAVNRTQLAQAAPIRGALPVAPTAASRQFSSRTPVAAGTRPSFANQSFYSRPGAGGGYGGRPAAPPPSASNWQRFGQTPSARPMGPAPGAGPGAAPGGGNWDRFGAPPASAAPQGRSFQVSPQIVRPREAAPQPQYARPAAPQGGGPNRGGFAPRPSGGGAPHGNGGGHASGSRAGRR